MKLKRIDDISRLIKESAINKEKAPLNDAFWRWFGKSVLKRANGNPIVANHYSNAPDIQYFRMKGDPDYKRAHSLSNSGIYFNLGETIAKYGKHGYYVYLKFEKPFRIQWFISNVVNPLTDRKIELEDINDYDIEYLTGLGYDSVVGNTGQVVAFNPYQIKSIYNDGTWDINDKNIYS